MKKIRAVWQSLWGDADRRVRLGRLLGLAFITIGFVIMFLGWNGAAGRNVIMQQFPYVISGGIIGLGLVITGSLLLFLSTVRAERQIMSDKFDEVARLLSRNLSRLQFSSNGASESNSQVVAAGSHYHRAECRLLQGKQGLTTVTLEQAAAEDLEPCRVCDPPRVAEADVAKSEAPAATSGTPNP